MLLCLTVLFRVVSLFAHVLFVWFIACLLHCLFVRSFVALFVSVFVCLRASMLDLCFCCMCVYTLCVFVRAACWVSYLVVSRCVFFGFVSCVVVLWFVFCCVFVLCCAFVLCCFCFFLILLFVVCGVCVVCVASVVCVACVVAVGCVVLCCMFVFIACLFV